MSPMKQTEPERALAFAIKALGLPAPEVEFQFARQLGRKWRFDFAWPDYLVACEVEGGTWVGGAHTRGQHFESDCVKYNAAAVLGWLVLRVTPHMIEDNRAVDTILATLLARGERPYTARWRCEAAKTGGERCYLPEGHRGMHHMEETRHEQEIPGRTTRAHRHPRRGA